MIKLKILAIAIFGATLCFGTALSNTASKDIPNTILLTKSNHVVLNESVTDESISALIDRLAPLLNNQNQPVYIVLDTPGGSLFAGFKLYEFLKPYNNVHTITINSYSMGAVLVQLISGKRLMLETGTLMFHRMSVSMPKGQKIEEINVKTNYYSSLEQFAQTKVANRAQIDAKTLQKELDLELYMDGAESLRRNFIDKIVAVKCSAALLKEKVTKTIQPVPFLPPMQIEVSLCPLL